MHTYLRGKGVPAGTSVNTQSSCPQQLVHVEFAITRFAASLLSYTLPLSFIAVDEAKSDLAQPPGRHPEELHSITGLFG